MDSDCGWAFLFKGFAVIITNHGGGVAEMGYEGVLDEYLTDWNLYVPFDSDEQRDERIQELRAILYELCPMKKFPKLTMGEIHDAQNKMLRLSQRGLQQVIRLINSWEGDKPKTRAELEIDEASKGDGNEDEDEN